MKKIIAALLAVVMIMNGCHLLLHPVLQKNIPIKRLPFLY